MRGSGVLAAALGAGGAASLVLLVAAVRGWRPSRAPAGPTSGLTPGPTSGLRRRVARSGGLVDARRLSLGVGVGVVGLVVARGAVAGVAALGLVVWWPRVFGAARASSTALDRLEALTTWTESLRDTIAGSIGLEQAIPATLHSAPDPLQPALRRLCGMLAARVPLPVALVRFAEEFDDPSADLVVAALVLNSRLRGPGLVATLTALAATAREELEMRRRIDAGRRSLRQAATIIVTVTICFAAGLALFSRAYVAPYATIPGQVMLGLVLAVFAAGFAWMRQLATLAEPDRFLADSARLAQIGGVPTTGGASSDRAGAVTPARSGVRGVTEVGEPR